MVLVYVVLTLLVVAVCVLFAMFGELAAQAGGLTLTSASRSSEALPAADPILDANLGRSLTSMPMETLLRPVTVGDVQLGNEQEPATSGIIVLSTICRSCTQFAQEWASSPHALKLPTPLTTVITARDVNDAEQFVSRARLSKVTNVTFVFDRLGDWCRTELNVNTSPALVMLGNGTVSSAWRISSFTEVPTLWHKRPPMDSSRNNVKSVSIKMKKGTP